MKKLATIILLFIVLPLSAQPTETFDLATYTVPSGWKKTTATASVISYVITNNQKGTYGQIGIYASTNSKGNLDADFQSEWQELVVKTYKPTKAPEMTPTSSENGWNVTAGVAPFEFNGAQSAAMLVTASNNSRCMSIVVLTNTSDYQADVEKFLESVDLKKTEVSSLPVKSNAGDASILGTWSMTTSDQSNWRVKNGATNSIVRQYTFNADGSYTFVTKTFDPFMDKLLFEKETGRYQIDGKSITIDPQKSVLQSWSKKNGTDHWGNLLSTQDIPLEKVTYQFTKHYFSGIQEWSLVLQASTPTRREGPFSNNLSFNNAYYYMPISSIRPLIEQPAGPSGKVENQKSPSVTPATAGGFAFTTTNFDDGWTSTVQEDWVRVSKGDMVVLIHYPTSRIDVSSADYKTISNNAWNTLVAPRYSNLNNFVLFPGSLDYERPHFVASDVTDNATGKKVYVALFKRGNTGWIEFVAPDKNSFVKTFGLDISKVDYYTDSGVWDPLKKMVDYNKFAVGPADLNGKWTNSFSGMTQYVNVYTGLDAGATAHSSNEFFDFKSAGSYHWEIAVASGMVGNQKFDGAKSDGTFNLPSNWQIHFSNLEGKAKTYDAFFTCVKGARLLWMQDVAYPSGYTAYGKKN